MRAAALAADGASADETVLDAWLPLIGAKPASPARSGIDVSGPAVPGGLAVKIYPCCYALQRPISALTELASATGLDPADVQRIELRTPEATVVPLIHHRPDTGLQGKFSLEYASAAALLDQYPGFASFTDDAVRRDAARRLAALVETTLVPGGDWLLDGELQIRIHTGNGDVHDTAQRSRPVARRDRRLPRSCLASWQIASPGWTLTGQPGPGRTQLTCSAGSCRDGRLRETQAAVRPATGRHRGGVARAGGRGAVRYPPASRPGRQGDQGGAGGRLATSRRDYDRTVLGQSSYFVWLNRGKESIELDVKSERGSGGSGCLAGQGGRIRAEPRARRGRPARAGR